MKTLILQRNNNSTQLFHMTEHTYIPRCANFPHLTLKTGDPSLTAVRGGWGFDRRTEQQVVEGVGEAELHEEPIADSL